ncbi:MAG: heparin lyase I family protein [Solirubrobacteraceae bacterium]
MRIRNQTPIPLRFFFVLLLAGVLIPACASRAAGTTPVSFSGGCDSTQTSGDLEAGKLGSYDKLLIQAPERLQATTDPSWDGRCAMRFEVHEGDVDSNQTDRAEVAGNRLLWSSGEEVWYSMSFMLTPEDPLPSAGQWMLVDQFFAQDAQEQTSGGSPPLALEVTSSKQVRVFIRGGAKASPDDRVSRENSYLLAAAEPGIWHEVLLHVRWSTEANGMVEAWQRTANGSFTSAPQVSASGPNILTVAGHVLPVYVETGIYRSRSAATQVVYYGGVWARPWRSEAEAFFPSSSTGGDTPASDPTAEPTNPEAPAEPTGSKPGNSSGEKSGNSNPTDPGATNPEATNPEAANPGAANSGADGPQATDPEATEPSLASALVEPGGASTQPTYVQAGLGTIVAAPTIGVSEAVRNARRVVIDDDDAIARAIRSEAGTPRLRDPSNPLRCSAIVAGTTIALEPGSYHDSLSLAAALHGTRYARSGGAASKHSTVAAGQLKVGATGRYRFKLRLTSAGCAILREAQHKGVSLRLLNSLDFSPKRGPLIEGQTALEIRL